MIEDYNPHIPPLSGHSGRVGRVKIIYWGNIRAVRVLTSVILYDTICDRDKERRKAMAKHTPGPWTISHSEPLAIDTLYFLHIFEGKGEDRVIVCQVRGHTSEECLYRAKLLIAAPDLYEALEYLMFYVGDVLGEKENSESYTMAKQAIAKATEGGNDAKDTS